MKTKKIQKPFSVEEWRNGAKVETRDGRPVRVLCTDAKTDGGSIVGIISYAHKDSIVTWFADGRFWSDRNDEQDLVIVEEVEEPERWADDENATGEGWYIGFDSTIWENETSLNDPMNFNEFATERLVKSALAMARISQLMAHDERYGGVVTDEEWKEANMVFVITRVDNKIDGNTAFNEYYFLAFHTLEQRELFLSENEQLVKDYLMID